MVRQPRLQDLIIVDEKKYVIRALIAEDESIVVTLLGGPSSRVFVLRAQLTWQTAHDAWRPVAIEEFFEADEPASDRQ